MPSATAACCCLPTCPPHPPGPAPAPQIEFYFSDSNLPRDKFLSEKVAADADGYVDLALLAIFSRVAALLKSPVRDPAGVKPETVADVADALEGSEALQLSEDRKRVRRTTALKPTEEVRRWVWWAWPPNVYRGVLLLLPAALDVHRGNLVPRGAGWLQLCSAAAAASAAAPNRRRRRRRRRGLQPCRPSHPRCLARRLAPAAAEQVQREVDERSIYASPFPYDASLDALSDFFRQVGGRWAARLPRNRMRACACRAGAPGSARL